MVTPLEVSHGCTAGGGTRAGLFRTPISGGVQSATSAHGLPKPALAVRNLMEQVGFLLGDMICKVYSITDNHCEPLAILFASQDGRFP